MNKYDAEVKCIMNDKYSSMKSETAEGLISIIIPAYNSAAFIETTLNNLFSQTYQNFEIIIAYDEKSTDNTLGLLQKINETHPIIIDIGKDTSSGCARNRGFRLAKGEYIIFVDADDEIHPKYLETMITIFREHPELNVVCCDYVKVYENTIQEGWAKANASPDTYTILNHEDALYKLLWMEIVNTPWVFMTKRQYMIDYNISFPDYSTGDDVVYAHKLIANSEKVGRSDKKLYIFIIHQSSITHQITLDNRWDKYEKSRNDVISYFKESDPIYSEDYMTMMVRNFVYTGVLVHEYPAFIKEINTMGFTRLSTLHKHDKLPYKLSVICYAVSKRIFYSLARFTAGRMKDITPMGKKVD